MIQIPIRVLPPEARVSDLIDAETKWWNTPLIKEIFWPEEANNICSMPISPSGRVDKLVWSVNANGIFFVRNAYHLAKER